MIFQFEVICGFSKKWGFTLNNCVEPLEHVRTFDILDNMNTGQIKKEGGQPFSYGKCRSPLSNRLAPPLLICPVFMLMIIIIILIIINSLSLSLLVQICRRTWSNFLSCMNDGWQCCYYLCISWDLCST